MDDKPLKRNEIVNGVHASREFFEPQCRIFAERVAGYAKRLIGRCQQQRAAILERLGKEAFCGSVVNDSGVVPAHAVFAEEAMREPRKPGWIWDADDACLSHLDFKEVHSVWLPHWRPAEDTNLLLWFDKIYLPWPSVVSKGAAPRPKDQLLHDAVLLAIGHDYDTSLAGGDPRVFGAVPAVDLWPREAFFEKVNRALLGNEGLLVRAWERIRTQLKSDDAFDEKETSEIPTLDEGESKALDYLYQEFPQIRYQSDIASAIGRNRDTVSTILERLFQCGLASHPRGKKTGHVITQNGQEYCREFLGSSRTNSA